MHRPILAFALFATSLASAAQDQGLRMERDGSAIAPWQARLEWGPSAQITLAPVARQTSIRLVGEYPLGALRFGVQSLGSLSLFGGLLHGPRGSVVIPMARSYLAAPSVELSGNGLRLSPTAEASTWSYLGLGYAASTLDGVFGFRADLGVAAQNPRALGLGRLSESNGLDSVVRDLRLTPVLRLGMSYRF